MNVSLVHFYICNLKWYIRSSCLPVHDHAGLSWLEVAVMLSLKCSIIAILLYTHSLDILNLFLSLYYLFQIIIARILWNHPTNLE